MEKSWEQKHVDRNSILESQVWSVMIFEVDTSQQKEFLTTSDWKTELLVITLLSLLKLDLQDTLR